MEAVAFDLIEEYETQDISGSLHRSLNQSKIINRLCIALDKYDAEYDILPELELELLKGKCKPDVCIFPNLPYDWENDVIYYNKPPITAIEVQSPKQATTEITDKANNLYFPSGVQSVWIIVPMLRIIQIRTFNGSLFTFTEGLVKDPITKFEVIFEQIFR